MMGSSEQRRAWLCAIAGVLLAGAVQAGTRDADDLPDLLRRAAAALATQDVRDDAREALVEELVRAADRLDE